MVMKFTNNATSTLAAGINSSVTSLTVATGQGALFPALGAGDYFYCTLTNAVGTIEIVKVTARSTDTFTITRAQDGTTAASWSTGDKVELRLVSASLNDLPKLDEANTFTGANNYGTPASITLTNGTGLPLTTGVTGVLPEAKGGTGTTIGYYGFKNRIINGAMGIWQRATTYNMTASWAYGSVDRWISTSSPSTNGVFNRSTSVPTGFQYSVQMGRTAASTATSGIQSTQAIESVNCYDLAGQSITVSFWAKAVANFSASGSTLVLQIGTGTVADQAASNFYSWTGSVIQTQNNTITTTWTRYTYTVTIAANALEIGVNFYYTPTGTAGADDNVYITGVQLEKSSTATSFDYRPYGTELALCQRYYYRTIGAASAFPSVNGSAYAATAQFGTAITFPVQMRTTPTVNKNGTWTVSNCGQPSASGVDQNGFYLVASGSAAGNAAFAPAGSSTYLDTSGAEL